MSRTLEKITDDLVRAVERLRFSEPVTHVYNPLVYARAIHDQYLERYGQGEREIILLGMNPGPFGMAQTGVPFGEVSAVRDWLGLSAPVKRPANENPKRPILGLECPRSEVSGQRLWGWAQERFGTPQKFFKRFYIANHCPLVFMVASGRNFTPDKLPAAEREPLLEACDLALRRTVELMKPKWAIGVGAYAEKRIEIACEGIDVRTGRILHPSPASPSANRGWAAQAERDFEALGIKL